MVPLGPYHLKKHPQLHLVEPLKNEILDRVCRNAQRKSFFLSKICERIDEIRHFYGGADGYDNKELAEMMLRDACFLIFYMELRHSGLFCQRLGMSGRLFMLRNMLMLENQIPLWLISLIHPDYKSLLCYYLSAMIFLDGRMETLPWENGVGGEPIHLFEALIRACLSAHEPTNSVRCFKKCIRFFKRYIQPKVEKKRQITRWEEVNNSFRSATDLKAKGIYFRRSSRCLTDIKFFNFAFYAELHLPFFYLTCNSMVLFSNAIAFEMSPEARDDTYGMTNYFTFMKTLIHNVNDVKVLSEKGILSSRLTCEEVVELFKNIDTYGFENTQNFNDVRMMIEEHCNNKCRMWMADLINTKFKSPWTVIALAAAAFLLCLTFLQTYYTIKPAAN